MLTIQEHIALKEMTTIGLGGTAKYFCSCTSTDDVIAALAIARSKSLRVHILGGGSNTIFSDAGFAGLVLRIELKGISFVDDGDFVRVIVGGGEIWEPFVRTAVAKGFAGIECLSGIPGSVGATPIQNVGAYGQEVKDSIVSVKVLEKETSTERNFTNSECGFSYRTSRFKSYDADKYIVTEVVFRLKKNGRPTIHYPEVKKQIESAINLASLANGQESLEAVRNIVLSLRRKKSMVIDPDDANSRSVGSFFLNPIVDEAVHAMVIKKWRSIGDGTAVPTFPFDGKKKIPAAWLIEKSGFAKGYKKNGVGISENHTLALVNYHGSTQALLELASEIQRGVADTFGISLEMEANIVS
ncbi:MAG: UDP-N-acetylmuramate dehydrogenase [Bacteroidota bacterium]